MNRIALILGGGVSLGAYTAGAVTELVLALRRNESGTPASIDVVTGSSAGALTGALLARTLIVNQNLLPWIERSWVEACDATKLLDASRRNRTGWFDSAAIDQLTGALIAGPAATDDEADPSAPSALKLGFTLTNLDGVPYTSRFGYLNAPDRAYVTRLHADRIAFQISSDTEAMDPLWESVRQASVASASFPFAFPPVQLERRATDYPNALFPTGTGPTMDMWFADGGIFDNAPIAFARELADQDSTGGESRSYIVVDPAIRDDGARGRALQADPRSIPAVAGRLVGALLGQGAAKDWAGAQRVNARLDILIALLTRLPEISDGLGDPQSVALGRRIGELAEQVAEMKVRSSGTPSSGDDPAIDYLDKRLDRIAADPRYDSVLGPIESRAGRSRLAKVLFVLEEAAGLAGKDNLSLLLVSPPGSEPLSGDFMGNFGGLFNQEWRANDFRAGRRDTRRLLETGLSNVVSYEPDGDEAYEVRDLEASFDSMSPSARGRLEDLLGSEADRLMAEIDTGAAAAMFGWAWKPVVRRWLVQRSLGALRDLP